MKKIERRLKRFEIQPVGLFSGDPKKQEEQKESQAKELHQQVIERARMILSLWKDVPSVSVVLKESATAEEEDAESETETETET